MSQQVDIQPSSLKIQNIDYEDDRIAIDTHDLFFDRLNPNKLVHHSESHVNQKKINKENLKNFNQLDKEQNEQLLSSNQPKKLLSIEKQKNLKRSHCLQTLINKISRLKLTKHDIVMLLLNVLMLLILIIISSFFLKREPQNDIVNIEEILVMKRGKTFGGGGGEELEDVKLATLTFNDTITHVTAVETYDLKNRSLLLSLSFTYSNGKSGAKYGGVGPPDHTKNLPRLVLKSGEYINHIAIYEDDRYIVNPFRPNQTTHIIVGIYIQTNDQTRMYGSNSGNKIDESFENYFLAYPQGKAKGFIDSLCFTWYRYHFKNSSIIE